MEHVRNKISAATIAITVLLVGFALVSVQQLQAFFKKGAAEGRALRVSEANACSEETAADTPHFSGCSSII